MARDYSIVTKRAYPYNLLYDINCYAKKFGKSTVNDLELSPDQLNGLYHALSLMSDREQYIFSERYKQGKTLCEIANSLGVSRERVRQLITRELFWLRHPSRYKFIQYGCKASLNTSEENQLLTDPSASEIQQACNFSKQEIQIIESLSDSLECLNLSVRAYNCLYRNEINTISLLCNITSQELLNIRGLGVICQAEICAALKKHGLSLADERL